MTKYSRVQNYVPNTILLPEHVQCFELDVRTGNYRGRIDLAKHDMVHYPVHVNSCLLCLLNTVVIKFLGIDNS